MCNREEEYGLMRVDSNFLNLRAEIKLGGNEDTGFFSRISCGLILEENWSICGEHSGEGEEVSLWYCVDM